jgi:hypothetical protein
MEELLKSVWAQAGAIGLLAASGWLTWWLERQERLKVQAKRDILLEQILAFMHEQRETLDKVAEGLAVQKLLNDEFTRYRDRNDRNERIR